MRVGTAASRQLQGYWCLVSYDVAIGKRPFARVFGNFPTGELRLGNDGRISVLIAPDPAMADAPAALAYSGQYRCAGPDLLVRIETASIPNWRGTIQRRRVRLAGKLLTLESKQTSSTFSPHEGSRGRAVWRRLFARNLRVRETTGVGE